MPSNEWMLRYDESRDVIWTKMDNLLFKETIRDDKLERDTVLTGASVYNVLLDSEGNTWFASDGHGLYKYFVQDFDRFTK